MASDSKMYSLTLLEVRSLTRGSLGRNQGFSGAVRRFGKDPFPCLCQLLEAALGGAPSSSFKTRGIGPSGSCRAIFPSEDVELNHINIHPRGIFGGRPSAHHLIDVQHDLPHQAESPLRA